MFTVVSIPVSVPCSPIPVSVPVVPIPVSVPVVPITVSVPLTMSLLVNLHYFNHNINCGRQADLQGLDIFLISSKATLVAFLFWYEQSSENHEKYI